MSATPDKSRASLAIVLGFCALAIALYALGVMPLSDGLARARHELDNRKFQRYCIDRDLRDAQSVSSTLASAEQSIKPYREALLTPLLGSSAMRVKSLLDALATAAGLSNATYAELPARPLPVPTKAAEQPYVRQLVKMTCTGSYAAAVSFLLRVERDFPLMSIGAFTVAAQQDCARQHIEFVFECPAEGLRPVVTPARKSGGKVTKK